MKHLVLFVVLFLQGCVVTSEQEDDNAANPEPSTAACPPLPTLPPGATRFEERLNNAIVRELYAQCAESKR